MQTTNISWADYTWNPVTGCSHAGPECWNCWAETMERRQAARDEPPEHVTGEEWTQENAPSVVTCHGDRLDEPNSYTYPEGPGRVFVVSMGDLYHREVGPDFAQCVLDVCEAHPEHVWISLTKRPQNARDWDLDFPENVWLGTSVGSGAGGEYPDTTHRNDQLREVDVATRWISFEPLIEPIGDVDLSGIDWAVVGGETGSEAQRREMDHRWADDLRRQCREQDVAFHFKQSSARYPERGVELSVEVEPGVYESRKIREYPRLPAVTKQARREEVTQ
jgi:protein gp37